MTVEVKNPYARVMQNASARRVVLVSVEGCNGDNTYSAAVLSMNFQGQTQDTLQSLTFRNLAEPADMAGMLVDGQKLLVVELDGQWVTYHPISMAWFMAKIEYAGGNNIYLVREQVFSSTSGDFIARQQSSQIPAANVCELATPADPPLATGTLVKVFGVCDDSSPAELQYFFEHEV